MSEKVSEYKKLNAQDKIFLIGVFTCILSTQGILMNFIFSKIGLGFIKSALFEVGVCILIIATIYKNIIERKTIKLNIIELFIITYIFLEIIILLLKGTELNSFVYTIRETWLVILIIIICKQFENTLLKYSKKIINIILILNILNLIATITSLIIGPEKYMTLLTGRYIYPIDPELKFKISHISGILRSPALIGESASFSYFAAISFVIFDLVKCRKGKIIALLNIFFAFTRSGYLFIGAYTMLNFVRKLNFKKKYTIRSITISVITIVVLSISGFVFLNKSQEFTEIISSRSSTSERFEVWEDIRNSGINENILDSLVGGGLGEIGSSYKGNGILKVFDNTWIYLYYQIGFMGLTLWVVFLFVESSKNDSKLIIILSTFLSMLFINIFQSECVIALLPIAITICKKDEERL